MATAVPARIATFAPSLEEKIRLRAYELYLRRGATPGNALEDWLRAEAEIVSEPAADTPISIATLKKPRATRKKK